VRGGDLQERFSLNKNKFLIELTLFLGITESFQSMRLAPASISTPSPTGPIPSGLPAPGNQGTNSVGQNTFGAPVALLPSGSNRFQSPVSDTTQQSAHSFSTVPNSPRSMLPPQMNGQERQGNSNVIVDPRRNPRSNGDPPSRAFVANPPIGQRDQGWGGRRSSYSQR
jgi:hypothetical protein